MGFLEQMAGSAAAGFTGKVAGNLADVMIGAVAPPSRVQREQWEREDNSYQRTVNDMIAAGLNPAMMMNGSHPVNGAGSATNYVGSAPIDVAAGMSNIQLSKKLHADAAYQETVNNFALQNEVVALEKAIMENKKLGIDTDMDELNLHYLRETLNSRIQSTNLDAELKEVDLGIKISESEIKAVEAKYAEIEKQLNLEEKGANIDAVYSSIDLIKQQTANEKVKTDLNLAELWLKNATKEAQAEMVQLQRDIMSMEKEFDEETLNARIYDVVNKSHISAIEFEKLLAESKYFESNAKWDNKQLKMQTRTGYIKAITAGIRDVCIGVNQVASAVNPLIPKFKATETVENRELNGRKVTWNKTYEGRKSATYDKTF